MNETIETLYNNLDAKDKIINEQALEIAKLKEEKKKAIEYINTTDKWLCRVNDNLCVETIGKDKLLEILGDKEDE